MMQLKSSSSGGAGIYTTDDTGGLSADDFRTTAGSFNKTKT